jgi:hypothetical protein
VQVFPVPNLSGSRLTGICIEQRRVLVARFGTVIPSFADYRHTSKEILLNYRHVKTNGRVRIHRTIDVYHGGGDQDCGLVFIYSGR